MITSKNNLLTKKTFVYFIYFIITLFVEQPFPNSADSLLAEYSKNLTLHKHFTADFTQYRYIAMFKKPLISTGTISFSYPDKILFHYKTPVEAVILLNNNRMKRYRIEKGEYIEQPSMDMVSKPIIRNIMHFFKGDFVKSGSFNVEINKDKSRAFILIPSDSKSKHFFSSIEFSFSENLQYLEEIKLTEQSDDYILVKHEQPSFKTVPDSIFNIQIK
jgi:outer membrane lipoprotein-sorting protein